MNNIFHVHKLIRSPILIDRSKSESLCSILFAHPLNPSLALSFYLSPSLSSPSLIFLSSSLSLSHSQSLSRFRSLSCSQFVFHFRSHSISFGLSLAPSLSLIFTLSNINFIMLHLTNSERDTESERET
jgi:hypothetical protein